jgi:hypothetical protein
MAPSRPSVPTVDELRSTAGQPLAFLQPAEETPDPSSPSEASPTSWTPEPTAWASSSPDAPSDEMPSPAPTSSPASSTGRGLRKAKVQEASRKVVLMAGEGAHRLLSRDDVDEMVDLYRADEEDAKSIGDPVGSIVHRHGLLGDIANPDVMDGINALVGLVTYGWKQVQRWRGARQVRAASRLEQQTPPADEGASEAYSYGGTE